MEHIKFFLNRKFNKKTEARDTPAPVLKGTLTEAGARLMALGSGSPYHRTAYTVRLYQP